MTAHTWTMVSDELLAMPEFEERLATVGLHILELGPYEYPGMRWVKLRDELAPELCEGRRIDYTFRETDGVLEITDRRVLA